MTLKIDLDLESADPVNGFCTLPYCENFWMNFIVIVQKVQEILSGHKIAGMTFKFELDLE